MNGRNPQWRLSKTPALSLALPARVFIEVRQRGSHKPFVSCVCGRTMNERVNPSIKTGASDKTACAR
jgi:hypothetical protein